MMLAKALGIHFNYIKVSPLNGDHMKPEFVKVCQNFQKYVFR